MGRRKKIISVFFIVFLFALMASALVFAQRPLEVDYPEAGGIKPETTTMSLPEYVKYIFNSSLGIAGLIVFIGWLIMPAILIAGLIFGFKIIF